MFSNVCSSVPEELEDTKGVIRIRKLKKDTQHNDQKKKDKRTNNNLQSTTKHRVSRTPLKPGEGWLIRSLKKFIFRYQDLVEIYSVSAVTIINDGFSYSENV